MHGDCVGTPHYMTQLSTVIFRYRMLVYICKFLNLHLENYDGCWQWSLGSYMYLTPFLGRDTFHSQPGGKVMSTWQGVPHRYRSCMCQCVHYQEVWSCLHGSVYLTDYANA